MTDGFVYFTRDGLGEPTVHAISKLGLPENIKSGFEVIRLPWALLEPFHDGVCEVSDFVLSLSTKTFEEVINPSEEHYWEERFRVVDSYKSDGMKLMISGGSAELVLIDTSVQYPRDSLVSISIVACNQPNICYALHRFHLSQVINGEAVINNWIDGTPGVDYSIWSLRPGTRLSCGWVME